MEFYSYDSKYSAKSSAQTFIPARDLSDEQIETAKEIAKKVFKVLSLDGMARIDLFLQKSDSVFYFNEVNTIPGFTSISLYPALMKNDGITATALLNKLIELGIERFERRNKLCLSL
jgi:D-alanine-D-alanine ligase